VRTQIAFKASIVRQDEKEDLGRRDARSRKILNFGHTFGHALEKATGYRYFKHGEAVGYGIIFAAELSKILDILDEDELKSLNDVVHRTGRLPSLRDIDPKEVREAFQFDKKLIAESLQWILLAQIGKPVILTGKEVPTAAIKKTLKIVLQK
jgi:3-dehydroquinate synthase